MANYAVRRYKPAIVVRGVTTSITLEVVDLATGELVDLSAGVSWELTDAGGSSVASGSATVSTTTATAQISSSATTGLALSAFWTMTWQASGVGAFPEQAALVVSDAHCPITVADILAEAPELYGCEWRDADGAAVAWSTFIEAAYKSLYSRLAGVKRWPWKVVNAWAFRPFLVESSLAMIYRSLATDDNARYGEEADRRQKEADLAWGRIALLYDESEGNAAPSEALSAEPVVYLGGAPGGRRFTGWR